MNEFSATQARTKLMIEKLYDQSKKGFIENEWDEEFVHSVKKRFDADIPLTEKQISKLEELFERY